VGSLEGIRTLSRGWMNELLKTPFTSEFKAFYYFVFDYLKEDKKILSTSSTDRRVNELKSSREQ
jgi:hypothetical protein